MIDKLLEMLAGAGIRGRAVFVPPDIHNEAAFRQWLLGVVSLGGYISQLSATAVDDKLLAFADVVVRGDDTWKSLYALIVEAVGRGRIVGAGPVRGLVQARPALVGVKIDLDRIVEIVRMILNVIEALA